MDPRRSNSAAARRNPTRLAARAAAPAPAVPWPALALGGVALAGGLYLLLRPRAAAASGVPLITGGETTGYPSGASGTRAPVSPTPVFEPPGPSGLNPTTSPTAALVARLQASDTAKQVFALQALLYSTSYSDAVPDGLESSVLDGDLARLYAQTSTQGTPFFGGGSLLSADAALRAIANGPLYTLRPLPLTLPQDLIDAVNAAASVADPAYPYLQITAS